MISGKDGYLLLNKPSGITSFNSLYGIKKAFGTERVGHTGSLDKFAEGLLVVMIGRATRLVQWFTNCDKVYEGIIRFGVQTDTLDPEGQVIAEASPPDAETLANVLPQFIGRIDQVPPIYSSVHVQGKRAHQYANNGIVPILKPRQVLIHEVNITDYNGKEAHFKVRCSKGTYIRSLARDIALAINSRAYLLNLKRLSVGNFGLSEAVNVEQAIAEPNYYQDQLKPINEAALIKAGLKIQYIRSPMESSILKGKPFDPSWVDNSAPYKTVDQESSVQSHQMHPNDNIMALFDKDQRLLAITEQLDNKWRYRFVNTITS